MAVTTPWLCCRLLHQAEVPNLPTFSTKGDNGEARFTQDDDKWWRQCTGAPAFCDSIKKKFAHRVSTDGYSASVTTRRPLRQPVPAAPSRRPKRKRGTSDAADCTQTNSGCVELMLEPSDRLPAAPTLSKKATWLHWTLAGAPSSQRSYTIQRETASSTCRTLSHIPWTSTSVSAGVTRGGTK
ncbi:hypothetical protein ABBQ38_009646 [Trebouxia sp. C0009 RCD-2024]